MSKEEKQEEVKRIEVTGTCKYCGQHMMLKMPETAKQEDIDSEATRSCMCEEGEAARLRMYNQATADAWIDEKYKDEELMRGLMHNLADSVIWMVIDVGTIKQTDMVDAFTTKVTTVTMKRNADGQLIIQQQTSFKRKDKF